VDVGFGQSAIALIKCITDIITDLHPNRKPCFLLLLHQYNKIKVSHVLLLKKCCNNKIVLGLVTTGLLAGVISSAAYKKWEKAAIAGVSLVADAAEHLERTTTDKEVDQEPGIAGGCLVVLSSSHVLESI
jgi:hypothetical protein